ncbi:MAG: ribosomal-protein-alanine N-acetyltransferase [Saprospiraceae bacterium]|jgi:ribosomal-protein-alanine N-acetyltransferase
MNESVFNSFPTLHTERLDLIRHHISHAPDMFELSTDNEVIQFLDTQYPRSIIDIENKIQENISNFNDKIGVNWIINIKDSDEAIGYMGIWRVDKHNNRGELGYALKKKYWKNGIASEAAKTIINYGFSTMELQTIKANTNPSNIGSQALLTKLGFIQEAHFRQDYYFDGKYLDSTIYGLIKEDWKY